MLKLTENTFWSNSMDDAFKRARTYLKDHNLEESDYTLEQIEEHESFGCKLCIKHPKEEIPISYTLEDLEKAFNAGYLLGEHTGAIAQYEFPSEWVTETPYKNFKEYLNAKT